jgi:ZIP family zinc transporter
MIPESLQLALVASGLAGISTGIGAIPAMWKSRWSPTSKALLLGSGAGVMLSASVFSLVPPAIELIETGFGPAASVLLVAAGIIAGAAALGVVDRFIPHQHFIVGREGPNTELRRTWLLVIAIAIHNFPEGLAVGASFGTGEVATGYVVSAGIMLQNLPEGLVCAASLVAAGYRRWTALWITALTGLIETAGGLVGAAAHVVSGVVPYCLAAAAGAMLYVVAGEVIPESHAHGHAKVATRGFLFGFLLMLVLDPILA